MKKDMTKKLILLIMLILLLTGCVAPITKTTEPTENAITYDWMAGDSPVSSNRIGTYNYTINQVQNGFECTSSGSYWMCSGVLLYCDHGSDTVIRLCGRPDCTHDDLNCNAHFYKGANVCYHNGYMYVTCDTELIRLNPDGSGRVSLMKPTELTGIGGSGSRSPQVWNGIYSVGLKHLDDDGELVIEQYYTTLDGDFTSMERTENFVPIQTDGDNFIVKVDEVRCYHCWNVQTNEVTYLTEAFGRGYYGAEEAWYIQDGIIYRLEYASGVPEPMLDTGLTGVHALHAFSDCLVISNFPDDEQWSIGEHVSRQNLRFYNWELEFLGEVELEYPNATEPYSPICGETPQRIFLADNIDCVPRYYIDKSDLGTGTIRIQKLELPEDIEKALDEDGGVQAPDF